MMLTKKRVALFAIILTAAYFLAFSMLPESIIGDRRGDDAKTAAQDPADPQSPDYTDAQSTGAPQTIIEKLTAFALFSSKIAFLAVAAAIGTIAFLLLIFKRKYVKAQIFTFNRYKQYLILLVKRDFVSRYRKSILGVLWSVLNPLLTMLIMTAVFSYLFRVQIENFPVYYLSGIIMYNFLNEATTLAMSSIIQSEGVIKKIYVPKYVFPASRVISSLVNLGFSFIAFLIVFVFTGVEFQWTMLLFPIPMIYLFVFTLGVAMFMSSMAVFFRDLTYLYGVFLTLWMFLTPIMYPMDILPPWLVPLYGFNPLYHFVTYFRNLALWGTIPDLWANMVCISFSLVSLSVGAYTFMRKQDRYILYL
ncbi:MAG: ABC transporter permease [Oscillospiraceae bacterium]|nr:ABC transporter permease [Oscillospiraceae bacterium]